MSEEPPAIMHTAWIHYVDHLITLKKKKSQNLTELFPFSDLGDEPIKDHVNKISREPLKLGP